jgi:hypothetical protein
MITEGKMVNPKVWADFNNADAKGRLRLICAGTIEDLAKQAITLREGMRVTIYQEDDLDAAGHFDELLVDAVVSFSKEENCWVAAIDWSAIRHTSDEQIEHSASANGHPQSSVTKTKADER